MCMCGYNNFVLGGGGAVYDCGWAGAVAVCSFAVTRYLWEQ